MIEEDVKPSAQLQARFGVVRGQTQLTQCHTRAPLKIAKTFALDEAFSGCAAPIGVCVMDSSPGLLAGDRYQTSWHLEAGAHVLVRTQGFSRAHPSRDNPCALRQQMRLQSGAMLEWFPEPLLLYRDAALHCRTEVEMAAGATLLLSEIIAAGRIARGEVFQFATFSNRVRVRYQDELIFINQTSLRPQSQSPQRIGAWGNYTHSGSFLVFGECADETMRDKLRGVLEETVAQLEIEVYGGVSLLHKRGIAVLLLGRRACDLQTVIETLRLAAIRAQK